MIPGAQLFRYSHKMEKKIGSDRFNHSHVSTHLTNSHVCIKRALAYSMYPATLLFIAQWVSSSIQETEHFQAVSLGDIQYDISSQ